MVPKQCWGNCDSPCTAQERELTPRPHTRRRKLTKASPDLTDPPESLTDTSLPHSPRTTLSRPTALGVYDSRSKSSSLRALGAANSPTHCFDLFRFSSDNDEPFFTEASGYESRGYRLGWGTIWGSQPPRDRPGSSLPGITPSGNRVEQKGRHSAGSGCSNTVAATSASPFLSRIMHSVGSQLPSHEQLCGGAHAVRN